MIAGPLLLLILPLAMAGIVYIMLRASTLSALLAIATAIALGVAVITLPVDQPVRFWGERQIVMGETVSFLGRELILQQSDRVAMAYLFFSAAGLFLLAWRFTPRTLLFPIGLAQLSLLSGALLVRPLIYAVLLLEIAAVLSLFALQSEGQPPTRGGLRYLTFTVLALPGILVTHWLLERYAITPDDTGLLGTAALLLTISAALLLGVVPFHTWIPVVAGDSMPLAGAFVLTVSNGAVWFLLADFLEAYPWISDHLRFSSFLVMAGLTMAVLGGLLASAQRRLGPLIGFGALVDSGGALLALGMNSEPGLTLLFLSLFVRPFGLILMASGLSGLRARSGGDDRFEALSGLGRQARWSTVALVVGGLSVAGWPVSAGFASRWALCRALTPSDSGSALLLLLAGLGVVTGVWRCLAALLTRPQPSQNSNSDSPSPPESRLTATIVAVTAICCVGVGFFPQLVAPWAARLAEAYTFVLP